MENSIDGFMLPLTYTFTSKQISIRQDCILDPVTGNEHCWDSDGHLHCLMLVSGRCNSAALSASSACKLGSNQCSLVRAGSYTSRSRVRHVYHASPSWWHTHTVVQITLGEEGFFRSPQQLYTQGVPPFKYNPTGTPSNVKPGWAGRVGQVGLLAPVLSSLVIFVSCLASFAAHAKSGVVTMGARMPFSIQFKCVHSPIGARSTSC